MLKGLVEESIMSMRSLLDLEAEFERASNALIRVLRNRGKVLLCGNGGSSADALHMATELVCRFEKERRHLPAICLNASSSDITAMANDFSYEEVFSRALEAYSSDGDLLVVFSTSGNSGNIVRVLEKARELKIQSVAFLGREGGACRGLADLELVVPLSSTARIQECHKLLMHGICSQIDTAFAD